MARLEQNAKWLQWAVELQSMAQAGLYYGEDPFDRERYERIREIAAEMLANQSELPTETVKELFCSETGYQTPKLDTRAAIFQDGKILLVRENSGRWSLPGGWVEVNLSVKENAVKEVKEEAGLDATADFVIAVQDRVIPGRSARFLCGVPSRAEPSSPIPKPPRAGILLWRSFQSWRRRKIHGNKSPCVLRRSRRNIGKPGSTERRQR